MLRGELIHERNAYLSGRVDSSDQRSFAEEPENVRDKYAVAVIRQSDRATVGHILYNLYPRDKQQGSC